MKKIQLFAITCFILVGICVGLFTGFIISARCIPIPEMSESVHKAISKELIEINDKTGGMLEQQHISENRKYSETYHHWLNSLSESELNIVKYHDASIKWMIRLMFIGFFLFIAGIYFQLKNESKNGDL